MSRAAARAPSSSSLSSTSSTASSRPPNRRQQALQLVEQWFAQQGWAPFRFQRQTWNAILRGESGLIHATTGTGKTYAAWLGPILAWLSRNPQVTISTAKKSRKSEVPLQVLWLTPLRALAADTVNALQAPLTGLQIPWVLESRTGDTSASVRSRQARRLPAALVTTPESLSLMLTRKDAAEQFAELQTVIVDEWHELLSTKRGVQTELCLARLRQWRPQLQTWGLSATLGNTEQALSVLLGHAGPAANSGSDFAQTHQLSTESNDLAATSPHSVTRASSRGTGILIQGAQRKRITIDSLIPESLERFPWAGHLGLRLVDRVACEVDAAETSLIFTNTRSQTEGWYQALLAARPDWAGRIALHHGSLDHAKREWVEQKLRAGYLKCVVCTSTLDLGVDFAPVERVFQVGSPKGIARLLQRAGRSGHSPGQESRVTCVPAHALELLEIAAARDAVESGHLESRIPPALPIDLLAQHATTLAVGEGFRDSDLFREVRTTSTYADLPREDFDWVLDFITTGGPSLRAYPEYQKVQRTEEGTYRLDDRRLTLQHRLSIGTIVSDASLTVQYLKGGTLGTIEEAFLARLKPGDRFIFGGTPVELVQVRDAKVWVRRAKSTADIRLPRWMGGRMPLSNQLAVAIRNRLHEASQGEFRGPEMRALKPLLDLQSDWSAIPRREELLIERTKSREGYHLYIYPFAGRLVHEGIGALLAYRMARLAPITFSISVNDYGLELLSPVAAPLEMAMRQGLFATETVAADIAECMNSVEMARRGFREVASIAGLVFKGYPGQRKTARQIQASTGLLFDVFRNYDPQNLLLRQAEHEVLETQLEHQRLMRTLQTMSNSVLLLREVPRFSPLCFPLLVDRMRERLSSEKLADRIRRMQQSLESAAEGPHNR